jgi:serine/threonine-protein kinase
MVAWIFIMLALISACAGKPAPLPEPIRFSISIPSDRALHSFTLSPDGNWLVYAAEAGTDRRRRLFLRSLNEGSSAGDREVIGTLGAHSPFLSPDGQWIAFFAGGSIWKSPTTAERNPQKICDTPSDTAGATWTDDGRIVFAPLGGHGLMVAPASGGTAVALTALNQRDGELEHGWPQALPSGGVVFTVTQRGRDPHLEMLSPTRERKRQTVPAIGQAQFVSAGHLVYSYLGNLYAVAVDADQSRTRGVPVVIAKGVQTTSGFGNLGRAGFAVSRTGTLAWLRASTDDARNLLVRVDRNGIPFRLSAPAEMFQTPRVSPDGRRLAVVVRSGMMTRDIRVLDTRRPEEPLLTLRGGDNQSPAWMSDSRRLTFGSNRDGLQKIYVVSLDGPREPRPLFSADVSVARNPASWARTLPVLAFYEINAVRQRDVLLYRVGRSVTPVAATRANERSPTLSPDGNWIAYVSDASGRDEVYVRRTDDMGEARQVSRSGGVEPVWTREGLFYRVGETLMVVDLKAGAVSEPRSVFEGSFERDPGANLASYDVDPQGKFFIMLKSALAPRELRIVRNWGTELVRQVPRR